MSSMSSWLFYYDIQTCPKGKNKRITVVYFDQQIGTLNAIWLSKSTYLCFHIFSDKNKKRGTFTQKIKNTLKRNLTSFRCYT